MGESFSQSKRLAKCGGVARSVPCVLVRPKTLKISVRLIAVLVVSSFIQRSLLSARTDDDDEEEADREMTTITLCKRTPDQTNHTCLCKLIGTGY